MPAQLGFLGAAPRATMRRFRGPAETLDKMVEQSLGDQGERSLLVRQFVEWCLRGVWPKDYLGEILAIRNVFVQPSPMHPYRPMFRYMNDPLHVEWIKTPERIVSEVQQHGTSIIDCDEAAELAGTMALHIGRVAKFTAMGFHVGELSHVGVGVKEPKSGQEIWLDGVAGPREREAAGRAKELLSRSLDD
jgi:hypothetical protein